ncbi:hypothetical protein [Blastococcus xanthinilyticus]|uniref:Uncharacterized protein n=1 Tax=Blastococcus xanthinilyticus TaxID=1564164 RepID=A0A5S5D0S0_9ACTN|nr:hypothetical protein [Blastococcus xanthinilyticus]TYP89647.1 hypothetical protein BD833_102120 [Blastococcus xanthinilyticus]
MNSPARPWPTAVVLTVAALALGLVDWPLPRLTVGGLMVDRVPGPLWVLVLGLTAVCVAVAVVGTRRAVGARFRGPAAALWLVVVVLTAAVLAWNALYSAAYSTTVVDALIPVLHWLFTFVPAVLGALAFRRAGRAERAAGALGTGVVSLPLFALGWALLVASDDGWTDHLASAAFGVAVLGVLPLVAGIAIGAAGGRRAESAPPRP